MAKDLSEELKQLKKDYYDLEEIHTEEMESLRKVINTLSVLASSQPDMAEEIKKIKELTITEKELSIDSIDQTVQRIKEKILARERGDAMDGDGEDPMDKMATKVFEVCRIFRKIMAALIDDFYPMADEIVERANDIRIDCAEDVTMIDFKQPSDKLLYYIEELKIKISDDFRFVNKSFISFLNHVKELEASFAQEFGGEKSLKQIEYFEMKINNEIGTISDTFDIYTTINEVKTVVMKKLKNIKELVAFKKKSEIKKAQIARENIRKLQKRINNVEKDAQNLSKQAERFQKAATKDGLTNLFNRKALDLKANEILSSLKQGDENFSIVFFDIDKFKDINDSLGHVAGDKVLQKVAQCLKETFRKDDFIARYGGDEFVVVIRGLTEEMARERIEAFRKNLKRRRFVSYKDGEINITVSAGHCMASVDDTMESLFERADKIMYASKGKETLKKTNMMV